MFKVRVRKTLAKHRQLVEGEMRQASIIVPYVGIDGSSTPLSAPLITHIAGTGEKALEGLAALIPALVSTLFGILTLIGSFIPRDVPFLEDANGFFSASVDATVVPNTFSGPGVYPSVFDVKFRQEDQPKYAMRDMKEVSSPSLEGHTNAANVAVQHS